MMNHRNEGSIAVIEGFNINACDGVRKQALSSNLQLPKANDWLSVTANN